MCVAKEPSLAMSNQNWHTFLAIDINTPEKGETKAACCHQESLELLLPNSDMYLEGENMKRFDGAGCLVGQGISLRSVAS